MKNFYGKLIIKKYLRLRRSVSAFTLLELVVVVSIFVLVVFTASVSLTSFFTGAQLDTQANIVVQKLRKAQANSMSRVKDTPWGVYFDEANDSYTFFRGDSYALRYEENDEVINLPDRLFLEDVSFSETENEIIFSRTTGATLNDGSLKITDVDNNNYIITVNTLGQIEIN